MNNTVVTTIDLASVFKEVIKNNPDTRFERSTDKSTILGSVDDLLLKVTKTIGSFAITSVKIVTDDDIKTEILAE